MTYRNEVNDYSNEQYKKVLKQINLDKLYDNLLREYKKKNEPKKLKIEFVRKEK